MLRRCTVLLLAPLALVATGCPLTGGSGKDAGAVLRQLRGDVQLSQDVLKGVKVGDIGQLADERQALATGLDDVRGADGLTASQRATIADAESTRAALTEASGVFGDADVSAGVINGSASDIAQLRAPDTKPTFQQDLVGATRDALKDATCNLGFSVLTSDEQNSVHSAVDNGQADWGFSNLKAFPREVLLSAIEGFALKRLAHWTDAERIVDWVGYANDVADKADALAHDTDGDGVPDAENLITAPSFQHTREFYYFTRLCLKPPGL